MAMQIEEYDAGLLNDYGGGNIDWWQDYIRAELGRAYEYYQSQLDIQHCEAGPEYCQQCHLEDRSLALAAAVRYVQNNMPKLVSDEICMALTTPPAQPTPEQYTALEQALTRLQKRYAELEAKVAAQQEPVAWVGLEKSDMPDGEDPVFDHPYFIKGLVYAAKLLMEKNSAPKKGQP
jgi:hypothetical protein